MKTLLKKNLTIIALVAVLFVSIGASMTVEPVKAYTVTSYSANFRVTSSCPLRTGPAKTYSAKTTLSVGVCGSVTKKTTNSAGNVWYYIECGTSGWVYSGNVVLY